VLDFDNLRKGTVSEAQFRRLLEMGTLELTPAEYRCLLSKYQLENSLVQYKQFIDNMDLVFTEKAIDKDPLFHVKQIDRETTLPARRVYQALDPKEEQQLTAVIRSFRREIQNKRVLMKPHFQDFDRTKNGYISKNQFSRILHQFNLFPERSALDLVIRKYVDNGNENEVNYYQFCRDVDIFDEGTAEISGVDIVKQHIDSFKTFQKQPKPTSFIINDMPDSVQDLLARFQLKIKEFRIRVREFLRDFDLLRLGKITQAQFRSGLSIAKLPLSDTEFRLRPLYH